MNFLIDANLPRSAGKLLIDYGHVPTDVRDIDMGRATDPEIARYAKDQFLCIVTGDWGFADIRVYAPEEYHGIVLLGVPDLATPVEILQLLRSLLDNPDLVALLPGRLAIVERHKIRLRPPPP